MFKRKEVKIEKIKDLINDYIIDKDIKKEILDKVNFYSRYGYIFFDKKNLYGKYINDKDLTRATPAKEFLEIKFEDEIFICNYSDWSNRKIVNIIQNRLKGGNTKIYKKDIEKIFTYNNKNEFDVEEIEKIYNYQNKLIYESKLETNSDYDTYSYEDSNIIYNNNIFSNNFELERNWYISNGSIIKYELSKSFINESSEINERYSICPETYYDGYMTYYNYIDLDENLFREFMSEKITIDEVLKKIDKEKYNKSLVKSLSNIDII